MSERDRLEPLDPELAALIAAEPVQAPPPSVRARAARRIADRVALAPPPLGAPALGLAGAAFVAGGVIGAALLATFRPAPPPPAAPRIVYVDRPAPSADAPEAPSAVVVDTAPRPIPRASVAPAPSAADTLRAERALIDDARARLAAGDATGALARAADHARQFPKAQLEEEREAIAIQALVLASRPDEARARADAFRARWPRSVYLSAVDAATRSIP
jgi:hypothetical protein